MAENNYSNEAYVYWFYNKYDFKTYFGSRVAYEGSYKDDFITNYNSSSEDEEFLRALENGELVGEVIAVFIGEFYEEVGKRAQNYENNLIELYWDHVGKEHSYNHYANGKFNNIGRKATEKERENKSKAQLKRYEDPKEHEKQSIASKKALSKPETRKKLSDKGKKRFKDPKEHEKISIANTKRYKDPKEREKTSIATKKAFNKPEIREKRSINGKKRFEDPKEREKQRQRLINNPKMSKIVLQYSLDGEFIVEWSSLAEIKRQLGIGHAGDVCRGNSKQAGGFVWRYKEEDNYPLKIEKTKKIVLSKPRPVLQYDLDGNFIAEYVHGTEALKVTGIRNVGKCCKGERKQAGGYIWKFKEVC